MPALMCRLILVSLPAFLIACEGGRIAGNGTALRDAETGAHREDAGVAPTGTVPAADALEGGVWLAGDLHLHSDHSADGTAPLPELIAAAEAAGMGYFIATDHDNHVDGDVAGNTWADPAYASSSMLILYGAEWTTHRGHANTISARPYDHASFYALRDALDVDIAARKQALGIHFSANHPDNADSFSFSYDMIDSVEVWNSAIWPLNTGAVTIWDDLLKSGRPLTARGGSDAHHTLAAGLAANNPNGLQQGGNYVGTPTTWVYAAERSAEALVTALTRGRASISANPYAERVEFFADTDGDGRDDLMMGDIGTASGDEVAFRIVLSGGTLPFNTYVVTVVRDGGEFLTLRGPGPEFQFTDTPPAGERRYYRVSVTGLPTPYPQVPVSAALSGTMIALSNPIYFDYTARNR